MSNNVVIPAGQSLKAFLAGRRDDFEGVNTYGLNFDKEIGFAHQAMAKNDYLMRVAKATNASKMSLAHAIVNVASIGLSLNPVSGHAYLVPRDNQVVLDMSYRGMLKIAMDCNAIAYCGTELVYEGDTFEWKSFDEKPIHLFDPYEGDRFTVNDPWKGLKGGYCIARLPSGFYMVSRMTVEELQQIRNESRTKKKDTPWEKWGTEMLKKTLVRRAFKMWPQHDRMDASIQVYDTANPVIEVDGDAKPVLDDDHMMTVRDLVSASNIEEKTILHYLGIPTLDQLEPARIPLLKRYLETVSTENADEVD